MNNRFPPLLGILFIFLVIILSVWIIPRNSYIPITPTSLLILSIAFILIGTYILQDSIKDVRKDFKEKNASIYSQIFNAEHIWGGLIIILCGVVCLYYLIKRHFTL